MNTDSLPQTARDKREPLATHLGKIEKDSSKGTKKEELSTEKNRDQNSKLDMPERRKWSLAPSPCGLPSFVDEAPAEHNMKLNKRKSDKCLAFSILCNVCRIASVRFFTPQGSEVVFRKCANDRFRPSNMAKLALQESKPIPLSFFFSTFFSIFNLCRVCNVLLCKHTMYYV